MRNLAKCLHTFLLLVLVVTTGWAQSYLLKKVTVSGSTRIAETDIVKATGLKAESNVSPDDLKQAAVRLTDSGVFAEVNYQFDGRTAAYTVKDAEQFVPAVFENFVWFTDAELTARIRSSVPLFTGVIPLTGNLTDQVCAAIDTLLKEKGVAATAVATSVPATGQMKELQFRMSGLNVQIAEIRFPGATADHIPMLQAEIKNLVGSTFILSSTAGQLRQAGLRTYGKLGFLKAQFGTLAVKLADESPTHPAVALEVPVQEGDPYVFSAADWTGNNAISTTELMKLVDLKPGAQADTTHLAATIASARSLYGTKGYMYPQIASTATLDSSSHSAAFHLAVQEGPLYRMGKLDLQNLAPEQAELVRRVWELHQGDVYDASYPRDFLIKHPKELRSMNGWGAVFTQTIHDDTLVVDLSLNFQKLAGAR
jgi:outer membrane protein assembly factor BamA